MSDGLTVMINYTFSKEMDDLAGVRVPGADYLEYSVGTIDHPQVLTSTVVYKLPLAGRRFHALERRKLRGAEFDQRLAALRHLLDWERSSFIDRRHMHGRRHHRCVLLSELRGRIQRKPVAKSSSAEDRAGGHHNALPQQGGLHRSAGIHIRKMPVHARLPTGSFRRTQQIWI